MQETTKALFVPAYRGAPVEEITITDWTQYNELVEGTFDIVRSYVRSIDFQLEEISVYVNDEGLLFNLPHNPRASWWTDRRNLVGNAVITGGADSEGNTLDVPEGLVDLINNENQQWLDRRAAQVEGLRNGS